jgi:type III restriction enzyme
VADRIINSPINFLYRGPDRHCKLDDAGIAREIMPGRHPSQYFTPVLLPRKRAQQIELDVAEFTADKIQPDDFVDQVRDRVNLWRKQGYQGVILTTRRLLDQWSNPERNNPILFAQQETAEAATYLAKVAQKQGDAWIRNQLNDTNTACNLGLHRVTLRMAPSGKTVVMAMIIAWRTLSRSAQPNDVRFAKRFLVVTPSLSPSSLGHCQAGCL